MSKKTDEIEGMKHHLAEHDEQLEKVDKEAKALDTRMDGHNQRISGHNQRLDIYNGNLDNHEGRLIMHKDALDGLDKQLAAVESRQESQDHWIRNVQEGADKTTRQTMINLGMLHNHEERHDAHARRLDAIEEMDEQEQNVLGLEGRLDTMDKQQEEEHNSITMAMGDLRLRVHELEQAPNYVPLDIVKRQDKLENKVCEQDNKPEELQKSVAELERIQNDLIDTVAKLTLKIQQDFSAVAADFNSLASRVSRITGLAGDPPGYIPSKVDQDITALQSTIKNLVEQSKAHDDRLDDADNDILGLSDRYCTLPERVAKLERDQIRIVPPFSQAEGITERLIEIEADMASGPDETVVTLRDEQQQDYIRQLEKSEHDLAHELDEQIQSSVSQIKQLQEELALRDRQLAYEAELRHKSEKALRDNNDHIKELEKQPARALNQRERDAALQMAAKVRELSHDLEKCKNGQRERDNLIGDLEAALKTKRETAEKADETAELAKQVAKARDGLVRLLQDKIEEQQAELKVDREGHMEMREQLGSKLNGQRDRIKELEELVRQHEGRDEHRVRTIKELEDQLHKLRGMQPLLCNVTGHCDLMNVEAKTLKYYHDKTARLEELNRIERRERTVLQDKYNLAEKTRHNQVSSRDEAIRRLQDEKVKLVNLVELHQIKRREQKDDLKDMHSVERNLIKQRDEVQEELAEVNERFNQLKPYVYNSDLKVLDDLVRYRKALRALLHNGKIGIHQLEPDSRILEILTAPILEEQYLDLWKIRDEVVNADY